MAQVEYRERVGYPVQFSVDYPDRPLSRLSTAFRILLVSLICLGMLGFMLALWVQEFLDRTVLALRRQSGEEGNR